MLDDWHVRLLDEHNNEIEAPWYQPRKLANVHVSDGIIRADRATWHPPADESGPVIRGFQYYTPHVATEVARCLAHTCHGNPIAVSPMIRVSS